MLTQYHACSAEHAGYDEYYAKPPYGIESKDLAESEQCAGHAANGCRVGRYFPPHVDNDTGHLYQQGGDENTTDKMVYVQVLHQPDAAKIAKDGDEVWHHSALALSQFYEGPALMSPVEVNKKCRKQNGEEIDQREHHQPVSHGQHAHIT